MTDITKQDVVTAVHIAAVVAEAIRSLGTVPSGHLYAQLMGRIDLQTYNAIVATLKRAKLVEESGFVLKWIGPAIGT